MRLRESETNRGTWAGNVRSVLGGVLVVSLLFASGATAFERTEDREPCASNDPLRQPFFGDHNQLLGVAM